MSIEYACVLAGGLGTRLRALYSDRPKALVPLLGRPFMSHQIEGLKAQGINRVHIAGGYRADQLIDWAAEKPVSGGGYYSLCRTGTSGDGWRHWIH